MKHISLLGAAFLTAICVLLGADDGHAGCIAARRVFEVREAGSVPFRQPADLGIAGQRLLVLDDLNGRLVLLDFEGRSLGSLPLPGGNDEAYLGLGFGGADQIFLAASAQGKIVVLDLKGKKVREFPVGEGSRSGRPAGVLVSRGDVFVADAESRKIRVFTLDGKTEASWGGVGEGPQQFRSPFRMARDSQERLLVTDALGSRVKVFTPKGAPLLDFGEFGTTEGTLFRPSGLTVVEGDRIVVADNYFGSLQLFDAQGGYLGVLCGAGNVPLALGNPLALAAQGSMIYVLDTGGGRVSGFEIGKR